MDNHDNSDIGLDYETLCKEPDAILLDATGLMKDTPWLDRLQALRGEIDEARDTGALRPSQWTALICRSANIQDMLNGD